ncbi:hypothetical protein J6590_102743 [Homalodisca vitripennis]|nr:hypothetical protein J6590_102743 [Homalodisca vitripennis]
MGLVAHLEIFSGCVRITGESGVWKPSRAEWCPGPIPPERVPFRGLYLDRKEISDHLRYWLPCIINLYDLSLNTDQIVFFRMLGVKSGYPYFGVPSEVIGERFVIQYLHSRRTIMDIMFLFRLLNGYLDCPEFLCDVDLIVSRGTRSFMPTQYSYRSGISRLLLAGSEVANRVDFFHGSPSSFRGSLKELQI